MTEQRAQIETVKPEDPALAVKLKARPPVIDETYDKRPKHDRWTLGLLERTCFEFRAAGGWDGAELDLSGDGYAGGGAVSCEVLARLGEDAMPWGWQPSQGPQPEPASRNVTADEAPPREAEQPRPRFGGVVRTVLEGRLFQGLMLVWILAAVVLR